MRKDFGKVRIDITGERFGKLEIINTYRDTERHATYCTCVCDCGNTKEILHRHYDLVKQNHVDA